MSGFVAGLLLQCGAILVLGYCAARLLFSLRRDRQIVWSKRLLLIQKSAIPLSALSILPLTSEDLQYPVDQVWKAMGGLGGLWRVVANSVVLTEVIRAMAEDKTKGARYDRRMSELMLNARDARTKAILCLPRAVVHTLVGAETYVSVYVPAQAYVTLIARFYYAVKDFYPELTELLSRVL